MVLRKHLTLHAQTNVITHILCFHLCSPFSLTLFHNHSLSNLPPFIFISLPSNLSQSFLSLYLSLLSLFLLNLHQIAAQVRVSKQLRTPNIMLPDRGWVQKWADCTSKLISSGNTFGKPLICKFCPTVDSDKDDFELISLSQAAGCTKRCTSWSKLVVTLPRFLNKPFSHPGNYIQNYSVKIWVPQPQMFPEKCLVESSTSLIHQNYFKK